MTKCIICRVNEGEQECKLNNDSLICSDCCEGVMNKNCEECSHFDQDLIEDNDIYDSEQSYDYDDEYDFNEEEAIEKFGAEIVEILKPFVEFEPDGNEDKFVEMFKKPLPEELSEYYQLEEFCFMVFDNFIRFKKVDKVMEFIDILKENNQDLYKATSRQVDHFLIKYNIFKGDQDQLKTLLQNLYNNSLDEDNYKQFIPSYNQLYLNRFDKLLSKFLEENIDKGGEELKSLFKFFIINRDLERYYIDDQYSLDNLKTGLKNCDITIDECAPFVEKVFGKKEISLSDNLLDIFKEDKNSALKEIKLNFFKYMKKRDLNFGISHMIWNIVAEYWDSNNGEESDFNGYFNIDKDCLGEMFEEKDELIYFDFPDDALFLWGGVSIYQFLKEYNIIDSDHYENIVSIFDYFKKKLKLADKENLWIYNFVFNFENCDSISEEEKEQFKDSFELLPDEDQSSDRWYEYEEM